MKKTFYLIAALSILSTAHATVTQLSDAFTGKLTPGATSGYTTFNFDTPLEESNAFSITFTLNVSTLTTIIGKDTSAALTGVIYLNSDASANNHLGLLAGTSGKNNGFLLTTGSAGNTDNSGSFGVNAVSRFSETDLSGIDAAALTFTYSEGTCNAYLTTLTDGVFTTYSGTRTGYAANFKDASLTSLDMNNALVTSAYVFNEAVSSDTAKALNIAALPEPTTATLSLLALAGLVTRRRRS